MALYNNLSMDDYNRMAARAKRDAAEKAAQNLANRQAAVKAANKKTGGLVDTLVGIGTGIKDKVVDAGATLANMGKTVVGGIDELFANNATKSTMSDDSKRRNEIAQKYGYASYSDAAKDDNASQDFWNEIKSSNKKTQDALKTDRKTYENSVGNVQNINLNKAAGQALNTIDTVGMALGGGAGVAANILGGGLAGIGDQYKADAERGKTTLDLDNFSLKNAATGMAGGAAGSLAGGVLGKAATKASNPLTKALTSQLGQGIGSGAAAGAAGGFTGTLTQGGSLQDALANALEGAKGGAVGGGVMAGTMGLAGKGLNRLQNGRTANAVEAEPVDAQIVAKNKIQAPQAKAIEAEIVEPVNNRRGIAIKDFNAGVEEIPVKTAVETPSRGRYIDSVVAGKNLPEAKIPTSDERFITYWGDSLKNMVANGDMGEGADLVKTLQNAGVAKADIEALRNGAAINAADNNIFGAYGMNSRQDLPMLNRQEYYNDRTGKPGASITSEDIPAYMQDRMRNDAGKSRYSSSDNESIMREVFGGNMDKEQMYDLYEQLAQTTQNPTYTAENFGAALAIDPELNARVSQAFLDQYNPTHKIQVQGGPAIADTIPVADRTTRYAENTLPARTYEQPTARANKVMNAEPAIEAEVAQNGKATGWSGKDMTNAVKKRNVLQKLGDSLQETGQATKDNQVFAKLKGNTAEEMARKNSVQRLRELGFKPSDYKNAANLSEVANKWYSDQVAQTKTPIEAPQLRNIAKEVADDLRLTMENRADLEKLVNGMLDDAVAKDGKMSNYSLDRYTPADLEKVAKAIGVKEQNITTTNMGGSKKANRNLTPENEQYALALREVRNRLRNEIGEMADYNEAELVARLKNAGATQKQIDYTIQDHTLKGVKARTSLFEDARTMEQQMRSDALKRGANTSKSTDIATQVANEVGASGLVKEVAKPVAGFVGGVEKGLGKIISGIGNAVAGDSEALKGAGEAALNAAGKAGEKIGNATSALNDTTLSGMALGGSTVGDMLTKVTNRSIAKDQAEFANNRANVAQKTAEFEQAANDYTQAIAEQQAAENQLAQGASGAGGTANMLARINNAMELAMQAGDINAYSQLADLYKQAYNIYEMQNPQTKNEGKALTSTQSKALAGLEQLETLKNMQSGVRTALADSPLGGLIDLTGGDEYSNQAKSLALTLGYLQSGANITPKEAEKIGKAYIPTAFDSEETRQGKLARAEQLLRDYLADTSALQA